MDKPLPENHHYHADGSVWSDDLDHCLVLQHRSEKRNRRPEWVKRAEANALVPKELAR